MKKNETKTAPAGHYYTKSGNLVKGRLTKDAEERGARKSDPKDKMRSKTPPVTQYNPEEATDGTVSTTDSREAEKLAKKGIDVKLTDEMTEQENIEYSQLEIKTFAAEVGKALNQALEELGEEVVSMKVKGMESSPKGGGFELVVGYEGNNDGDEFSFYISGSELHLTDFTFDKVVGEVGTLPSGKPVLNKDVIKNNLVKHFRSKYLEEKKGKDHDGDGDIDSDDYLAAKDKAIKKAMKTEMSHDSAKDMEGNTLMIGDTIQVHGSDKMFEIGIGPEGMVNLYEKGGNSVVEGGTDLFRKVIESSKRVKHYYQNEDMDIGHQDDEPDMLKQYAYDISVYAAKLYKQLNKYDQMEGEVDFPNWWQAKVIKARDYIAKAQHYLEFEEKQPALDAMALENQVNERSSVIDDVIHDIRVHGEESGDIQGTAAEYIFHIANAFDINLNDIKDYLFEKETFTDEATLSHGTDYDDPYDDKHSEDARHAEGERLYDAGYELYKDGIKANDQDMIDDAEEMRLQALHLASDFDEDDLPPYSTLNEQGPGELDKIYDVILKYVKDPNEAMDELDNFISQGKDGLSDELYANLSRDPEFKLALMGYLKEAKEATCCHRCGRKHVKGTACKKPYLKKSDPRHCANK